MSDQKCKCHKNTKPVVIQMDYNEGAILKSYIANDIHYHQDAVNHLTDLLICRRRGEDLQKIATDHDMDILGKIDDVDAFLKDCRTQEQGVIDTLMLVFDQLEDVDWEKYFRSIDDTNDEKYAKVEIELG